MTKRQEIVKQIKELQEKLEKMPKGRERCEKYWHIINTGLDRSNIANCYDVSGVYDNFNFNTGNYYYSEKEAEKALEKMILIQKFKDFIEEINEEPIDWKNEEQIKYRIVYECYKDKFCVVNNFMSKECIYYSTNENFLKLSLERFGEDKLKIIYEVEE